jgi:hypothetical protein
LPRSARPSYATVMRSDFLLGSVFLLAASSGCGGEGTGPRDASTARGADRALKDASFASDASHRPDATVHVEDAGRRADAAAQDASEDGARADAAVNPACGLPIEAGFCNNAYPAYTHDPETGACLPFYFSRCGSPCTTGNANCFLSMEACEAACETPRAQSDCPADTQFVEG